ncbi:MAG: YceD family protein, partial [Collinsella sp.]|nr:YceD family protein [Collinsella sp.]
MGAFDPVTVDLTGRLENPGESLPIQGTLAIDTFEVGGKEFSLADGVAYDVVLTNAGDGILASGIVRASATGSCDRCLEPAAFDVSGEIEEYFLFEAPENEEAYEDGFEVVGEDRVIDLSEAINDAVVMDTPFVVLCRPDCQGICPT